MTGLVADHLWQSTAFALVVALLARACAQWPARVRHALWLAASLKFLVPFAALVGMGRQIGWRPVETSSAAAGLQDAGFVVDIISHPFSSSALSIPPAASALPSMQSLAAWLPDGLIALWLAGSVAVFVGWYRRWRHVTALVRNGRRVESGPVLAALRRLETQIGIRPPLGVVATPAGALEPGIFGIVSPVLIWPDGIEDRLDAEEIAAVIAHEVCHVRRRDNLLTALHTLVDVLFWYHPLVRWIGRRLAEERERACDEDVLRHGSAPAVYAESILKTCRLFIESPVACVSGVTGGNLKTRIETIMRNDADATLAFWKKVLLACVPAAAIAVPLGVGVLTAPRVVAAQQQVIIGGGAAGGADGRIAAVDAASAAFEVASVKPNKSGSGQVSIGIQPGGRFTASNVPLRNLIRLAYQLQDFQLVGAPGWVGSDRFDINAKAEGDVPPTPIGGPPGPMQFMVRKLLAERFNLKVHTETREMPIYELVVARADGRLGPQLRPAAVDCAAQLAARRGGPPPAPPQPGERPQCGMRMAPGQLAGGGLPLSQLATPLSQFVQRVVVDKTGLSGTFDLELTWTPDQMPQGAPPPGAPPLPPVDPNGPSIFTALQEQLGLKLESTRGPVEVLVIDSVGQPTPD